MEAPKNYIYITYQNPSIQFSQWQKFLLEGQINYRGTLKDIKTLGCIQHSISVKICAIFLSRVFQIKWSDPKNILSMGKQCEYVSSQRLSQPFVFFVFCICILYLYLSLRKHCNGVASQRRVTALTHKFFESLKIWRTPSQNTFRQIHSSKYKNTFFRLFFFGSSDIQ